MRLSNASLRTRENIARDFVLRPNFISTGEQEELVRECRRALAKMERNRDHFDSVITDYREVAPRSLAAFPSLRRLYRERILPEYFQDERQMLDPHIIELAACGCIKPHLDNVADGSLLTSRSTVGTQSWGSRSSLSGSWCSGGLTTTRTVLQPSFPPDRYTSKGTADCPSLICRRGTIRAEYEHEIRPPTDPAASSERISIMFRERQPG